ncbi:MAG: hypothetical protein CMI00_00455 [Oceanospirillaceae bacterium]|nr:hypothetical protein [Oceanospirillaceae bacterium]
MQSRQGKGWTDMRVQRERGRAHPKCPVNKKLPTISVDNIVDNTLKITRMPYNLGALVKLITF